MTYAKLLLQFAYFDGDWISKFPKRSKETFFSGKFSILISFSRKEDLVMNKCDVCCIHHDEAMKRWWFHFTMLCARWQLFEIFMKFRFTFHSVKGSRSSNRSWQFILIQTMSIINSFLDTKLFFQGILYEWFSATTKNINSWHTRFYENLDFLKNHRVCHET